MKPFAVVRPATVDEKRTHACKQCRVITLVQGRCPKCGQTMFPWDYGTAYRLRWVGGEKQKQKIKVLAEAVAYLKACQAKGDFE